MKDDPYQMNWVIDNQYLQQTDFDESDKLFGEFTITVDGQKIDSHDIQPTVTNDANRATVTYNLQQKLQAVFVYDLTTDNQLNWEISVKNLISDDITIENFGVWLSLAYVMFRDKNVAKNIHESAAVYPSISRDFTKINAVRRDNQSGNLGIYQTAGQTLSVGTYAAYNNLFFENVSPSLDGMLFHQLILAGGYDKGFENNDWIYDKSSITVKANDTTMWHYVMQSNESKQD